MTELIRSSVSLNVRGTDVKYIIFHTPEIELDHMVNRWVKESKDYTNVSLANFIRDNNPEGQAYTKAEAKELNIKRTL